VEVEGLSHLSPHLELLLEAAEAGKLPLIPHLSPHLEALEEVEAEAEAGKLPHLSPHLDALEEARGGLLWVRISFRRSCRWLSNSGAALSAKVLLFIIG
jgi:hypothetical protein